MCVVEATTEAGVKTLHKKMKERRHEANSQRYRYFWFKSSRQ